MRRTTASLPVAVGLAVALLVMSGCSDGGGDDHSIATTTVVGQTTTSTTEVRISPAKATLQFAPVVAHGPCPSGSAPTLPQPAVRVVLEPDGSACWFIGPIGADGNDIESAEVVADPAGGSTPVVELTPRLNAKPKLNLVFNACYEKQPTCPGQDGGRGQVAFIYSGRVRAAPEVAAADVGSGTIALPKLTLEEAARLTAVLNG